MRGLVEVSDKSGQTRRLGTRLVVNALRAICGDDLSGIKIILDLMNELERLHSEVRSLRNGIEVDETKMQYMRRYL